MSVSSAEPRHQNSGLIGFVIAIGILQIDRFGCVVNDRTAAINHDRSWNGKAFSENCELIGHMVTICVFTDTNAVAVLTKFIRIVQCFADPKTTSFIPVHCDWFSQKVAFVRVQSQCHSFGH